MLEVVETFSINMEPKLRPSDISDSSSLRYCAISTSIDTCARWVSRTLMYKVVSKLEQNSPVFTHGLSRVVCKPWQWGSCGSRRRGAWSQSSPCRGRRAGVRASSRSRGCAPRSASPDWPPGPPGTRTTAEPQESLRNKSKSYLIIHICNENNYGLWV